MDLYHRVLSLIVPEKTEVLKVNKIVDALQEKLKYLVSELKLNAEISLEGSIAKDTFLKDPDIDLFIKFSTDYSEEDLEKIIVGIGKKALDSYTLKFAQHPYVSGTIDSYPIDIVPCYKVKDPAQKISAVDRTPFHTQYILEHLKEYQKNEVRLLKQFLKGSDIYGAEAKVGGFSGYLAELLILKFENFENLIKSAASWNKQVIFSLVNDLNEEDMQRLSDKFKNPLIVLDPVDSNRNVASALMQTNYSKFIFACREFSRSPDLNYFFPVKPELDYETVKDGIRKRGTYIYAFKLTKPSVVDDVLYPQIYKMEDTLRKILSEFVVLSIAHHVSNYIHIVIELKYEKLPGILMHEGPPVWSGNAREFIEKWKAHKLTVKGPYIEGTRLYVDILNDMTTVEKCIIKGLKKGGIGKNLDREKKNIQIYKLDEIFGELPLEFLYNTFLRKLS